jgi:methyl-accepting chemotaxis protein
MLDPAMPETKQVFTDSEASIKNHGDVAINSVRREEIKNELLKILAKWQNYDQKSQQIIQLARIDSTQANAQVIPLYNSEFKPLQTDLEKFILARQQDVNSAKQNAIDTANRVYWQVLVLLIIVTTVTLFVVFNLSLSLQNGIREIKAKLVPLKNGDLTQRLPTLKQDELSEICHEVNEFIGELQNIVVTVREDSNLVSAAAGKLVVTANHVLTSTTRQVEATASVAATVEEFSVSIDHVSSNAAEAEHQAAQYGELSKQGGNEVLTAVEEIRRIELAVNNAVEKMQILGQQANEISSIVKVIKDVADQTNLLALNAAIEAARAGESGRGFSVVADEVRNLAERTARSAQEITSMISNIQSHTTTAANVMQQGNERVILGVKQAELAGKSMRQINQSTSIVTRAISDISLALREQRAASSDIAKNVEAISQMTEANNYSVSEVSSAAFDLENLAATLNNGVAKFKV